MSYDFLQLSPVEFERLCCDLIQKNTDLQFQLFKEGRDNGLDLCHEGDDGSLCIVQCKRYSNISNLLTTLREEVKKVNELKPARYLVAVSLGLTHKNKKEIQEMFKPYIKSTSDIYANDDLNKLLRQYPQIEKSHFKLWLSSTVVLDQIFNKKQLNQVSMLKEEIEDDKKYLVLNESYNNALEILTRDHFVIISGVPGIGKSTLARALCYYYIDQGYMPVEISDIIQDGFEYLDNDKQQVFLFEDFLGTNFYKTFLSNTQQQQLIRFITKISNDSSKKLIMTTREYIMKQAENECEIIASADLSISKCHLDLGKFHMLYKARLLYNRLFFSSLPVNYINALIVDKQYISILKHPNFNPRIVQVMTRPSVVNKYSLNNYPGAFIESLNDPKEVWTFAFNKHLSSCAKYILYLLLVFDVEVTVKEMGYALKSLLTSLGEDVHFFNDTFKEALNELQDTFVNLSMRNNILSIRFENHSIRDYLINKLTSEKDMIELLISSAVFIETLFYFKAEAEVILRVTPSLYNPNVVTEPIHLEDDLVDLLESSLITKYKSLKRLSNSTLSANEQIGMIYHMYNFGTREGIRSILQNDIQEKRAENSISNANYIKVIEDLIVDSLDKQKILENVYSGVTDLMDLGLFFNLSNIVPKEMRTFLKKFDDVELGNLNSMIMHNVGEELYDPIFKNFEPIINTLLKVEELWSIETYSERLAMAGVHFVHQITSTSEKISTINNFDFKIEKLILSAFENLFSGHSFEEHIQVKYIFPNEFNSFCLNNKELIIEQLVDYLEFDETEKSQVEKIAKDYNLIGSEIDYIWEEGFNKSLRRNSKIAKQVESSQIKHINSNVPLFDYVPFNTDNFVYISKESAIDIERMFSSLVMSRYGI
ncbi:restriction endonuclease [Paenibacillus sp. UASWS1643]|uniref:nSTAND3 domain-containing NTPase n=1 Tax=Paenibacillus sp. UASWS1643 TaxID=2580422 RepID=UPI00123BE3FF|nr:restriction endonuclease [Paenibacillus sp. UASWS1643]KAA8750035.1 hypothetical protein FE296_15660 [Paenibacillus sp. UASWS1643]